MDIQELIRSLVNQAGAKVVYGEPISAEGKTIVLVAKVRYGFGGGSGRKGGEHPDEDGGGGGGMVAYPIGYIELSSAGTRYVPITEFPAVSLAVGVGLCAGLAVGKVLGR